MKIRTLGLVPLGKQIMGTAGGRVVSYFYPCSFHLLVNPEVVPPETGKTEPRIRW